MKSQRLSTRCHTMVDDQRQSFDQHAMPTTHRLLAVVVGGVLAAMDALVKDLVTVLETYLLDDVQYLGYSLGARVGWQMSVDAPRRVRRAVLGGIPDGRPLARLPTAIVGRALVEVREIRARAERAGHPGHHRR